MDFTAIDEVVKKQREREQDQQLRPTSSSLDIFKLIRKRQWEDRVRHKLAQSTLNKLAAERKMKYISTLRSNPYIDRTVIFNQFTSGVIQQASATILNTGLFESASTNSVVQQQESSRKRQQEQQQQFGNVPQRFNLNRNELNLLNGREVDLRVSSATLANKFDIVIPTGIELPPIKPLRQEHESVFERLNPKFKKKRHSISKVACLLF